MTRPIRWFGLAAVLGAAAVLSFHGLRDLALAVSIQAELAWLLPIAVDAGAAVSCACWLSRELAADAQRFARSMTWLLLGGTVAGNAAQLGMHAAGIVPPWWVAVIVGAIPPAVVGGTVHLAVLVGRPTAAPSPPAIWIDDEFAELLAHEAPSGTCAHPLRPVPDGPIDERAEEGGDDPPAPPPPSDVPDRRALVNVDRDGAIVDDLRALEAARGRRWSRDEVKDMYGIGSRRASRLLTLIGWMPRDAQGADVGGEGAGA